MNSSTVVNIPGVDKKPLTAGFQLETKIRLIIQEVLNATIRKLALFGEKVDKFQEYFVTFKERFETGQRERGQIHTQIAALSEIQTKMRRDMNVTEVKYGEDKERQSIAQKEIRQELRDMQKSVKTLLRQNQNINSELSKTKSKFLEYSNTITNMKEDVSSKITKYLQETAQSHTQMKVTSQDIKLQNFNMNLQIEKQKEKYDNIILKYEEDLVFRQEIKEILDEIAQQSNKRADEIAKLNVKVDDLQLMMLSKIKNSDNKFEQKMKELDKNNTKLTNVFKKIDNFNALMEGVKQEIEENASKAEDAIEQSIKKSRQIVTFEVNKLSKQQQKLDKKIDKSSKVLEQKIQKSQDFVLQKIDFAKMQIQSSLSSKTSKMIEQKARTDQHLNSSSMQQINSKLTMMQIQITKNINKTETILKEQIVEVKKQVEKVKEQVQISMSESIANAGSAHGHMVSGQKIGHLNGQLNLLKAGVQDLRSRVESLEAARQEQQKHFSDLSRSIDDKFMQSNQKLTTKIEKVMFLVTKMRGDSIIRNQFNDKQIRQLKKSHIETKDRIQTTWKIIPGIGQCINTIMAVIFDAQFQHSKIIQDNLPMLAKDVERFNTTVEGVIYEYKQKKKPGIICYRHNEIKKADLLRATFFGYIQLWEQIFEAQSKNKQNILPKTFYKRLVQKHLKGGTVSNKSDKQSSGGFSQFNSLQQIKTSGNVNNPGDLVRTETDINNSFHIRKKKTLGKDKWQSMLNNDIKQ